jgi:tRNA pseudouridine38-40 synthase
MKMTCWKLTLAYDGAGFHGWQVQPGETMPTIQGELADAIAKVTGERVLPQGSGRTDAGVHALGQVASFHLHAPIPEGNFQRALNRVLPAAIRVLSAETAAPGFHARHSVVGKIYQYRIFQGRFCPPFLARRVAAFRWTLNVESMQQAANAVLGEHDFTSFAAVDPDRSTRIATASGEPGNQTSNLRRIEQSEWSSVPLVEAIPDGWLPPEASLGDARILTYTVRGNGFLHHMVRNLVGTFLETGRGRIAPDAIAAILAGRDRSLAGPTAPAQGLCLVRVLYPPRI